MIAQLIIGLTGCIAIWLTQQRNEELKKYACYFGLAGQPFWIAESFHAEQWGVLALSFFYSYIWWEGFKNHWLNV